MKKISVIYDENKNWCISCGKEIPAEAKICKYCGTVQRDRLKRIVNEKK